MPPYGEEELNKAEQYLAKCEFVEARKIIDQVTKTPNLPKMILFRSQLLTIIINTKLGQYNEALTAIDTALTQKFPQDTLLAKFQFLIAKIEPFERLGKNDNGIVTITECETLLNQLGSIDPKIQALSQATIFYHKGILYWRKGDLNTSFNLLQQSMAIFEKNSDKLGSAKVLIILGNIADDKGENNASQEYFHRSCAMLEELGNKQELATCLNGYGVHYWRVGDLNEALKHFGRSLNLRKEIGNKRDLSYSISNIGMIYHQKGELNQALEHYKVCLALSEELGNIHDIARALNNLGLIYQIKGELDESLKYNEKNLVITQQISDKQYSAFTYGNMGILYHIKGDYIQALDYYRKALVIFQKLGRGYQLAELYYRLIAMCVDKGSLDQAKEYLTEFEKLAQTEKNRATDQRYRLARALIFKYPQENSKKLTYIILHAHLSNLITAQALLRDIIAEEIVDHELTVDAILNLAEVLISELKTFGNETVLLEINQLTQQLIKIGETQNLFGLLAKTYLILAQLALLEPNIERAKTLLTQAHSICQQKGLDRLSFIIAGEQRKLEGALPEWLTESNLSLLDRLGKTQLESIVSLTRQNKLENLPYANIAKDPVSMEDLQAFTKELSKRKIQW